MYSNVKLLEKSNFIAFKMVKMAVFDLLKSVIIDFTSNQSGRKIAKFPHCAIETSEEPPIFSLFV